MIVIYIFRFEYVMIMLNIIETPYEFPKAIECFKFCLKHLVEIVLVNYDISINSVQTWYNMDFENKVSVQDIFA